MKTITFATHDAPNHPLLGIVINNAAVELREASTWAQGARCLPHEELPASMLELLHAGPAAWAYAHSIAAALESTDPLHTKGASRKPLGHSMNEVILYPPLPRPMSLRDFFAFEAHVQAAFANRGKEVPAEWYQLPVFYYSNPNTIFGPFETIRYPSHSQALDYELEIACVIGRPGTDIPPEQAVDFIFGYTIFNDWSARDIQGVEMRVGLGPAKGKDFASSLGPWIVTPDELADRATGRHGVYDLQMIARVNGQEQSCGNWKDIHYSFGEMIARASQEVLLIPGDVIGSGTVGSGCLLELTRGEGPWLQPGDVVELEIERFGVLANRIGKPKSQS